MPRAIIAGIPIAYDSRLQRHLGSAGCAFREGWEIEVVRSPNKSNTDPNPEELWRRLKDKGCNGEGRHILAFGGREGRQDVERMLLPYYRLRWLDGGMLYHIMGSNPENFFDLLNEELGVEELWAQRLMPQGVESALLLPRACFSWTNSPDVWMEAHEAGDEERIERAATGRRAFEDRHFVATGLGRRWIDQKGLLFNHAGARHEYDGERQPRCWKYSFPIPLGFHYDVTALDGKAFSLDDHAREPHKRKPGKHINVDVHGVVRD